MWVPQQQKRLCWSRAQTGCYIHLMNVTELDVYKRQVLEGEIEVNESLLTGESDGVSKKAGDSLLSGSFVIAGKACAEVVHVRTENYASALAAEVKKEKQMYSELSDSMKRVTRVTSCFIIPLGLLLLCLLYTSRRWTVYPQ